MFIDIEVVRVISSKVSCDMKRSIVPVTFICVLSAAANAVSAATIGDEEVQEVREIHQRWWGADLEWEFDALAIEGSVEKDRMPWPGYIYPDRAGGCEAVLRKYDQAFHEGRALAAGYEQQDIRVHRREITTTRRAGLLGLRTQTVHTVGTPHWAGHCNGWTAAAIRHAQPENNVTRNGVVFSPADIKGLLAELYVYCDIETLGGAYEEAVNPATLHVILANWIGRGKLPIGMDRTLGKEVWNYPIYAYKSSSARRGDRLVEVKINVGFIKNIDREQDAAPVAYDYLYLHYDLDLDEHGKITGGSYYRDSSRIDLLWAPLQPAQGGQDGNKKGNPHLDVKEVMALWRDSVPAESREQWYNINPWPEDAVVSEAAEEEESAEPDTDATQPDAE